MTLDTERFGNSEILQKILVFWKILKFTVFQRNFVTLTKNVSSDLAEIFQLITTLHTMNIFGF